MEFSVRMCCALTANIVLATPFSARVLRPPSQERSHSFRFAPDKRREAKRRKAQSNHWPRSINRRCRSSMPGRGCAPLSGRARLPAPHRGTRQAERIQPWLSSRTALPETRHGGRYPLPPVCSLPRSAETGRSAGRAGTRSRPGAACETARGHRTRSAVWIASGMRPS